MSYKAALNEWHKGTGGGSGLETEFEQWGDDVNYAVLEGGRERCSR